MLGHTRGRWLLNVALLLGDYDADIRWIAAHAAHLAGWSGGPDLGWLLAGAIDVGGSDGDDVQAILEDAMCRGDQFEPSELRTLLDIPFSRRRFLGSCCWPGTAWPDIRLTTVTLLRVPMVRAINLATTCRFALPIHTICS